MPQTNSPPLPESPWSRPREEILDRLAVAGAEGLDDQEVVARRKQYGPNRLRGAKRRSAWAILVDRYYHH